MTTDQAQLATERSSRRSVVGKSGQPLAQLVAGSAFNLLSRSGLSTLISGFTAIAITRLLGPSNFGQYASAIAIWTVLGAAANFGFTLMLARDMARVEPGRHRKMLYSAYHVATSWSVVLAIVMVALAIIAGPDSTRGACLLVLAPSMVVNGLNPARAFFEITYETRRLLVIDVSLLLVQVVVMITLAAVGLGPVAVAATVSAGSIVDNLVVSYVAARMLEPAAGPRYSHLELIRGAAPLGLVAVMSQVYLMIDLVLLGWLVRGPSLGQYAAASKLLTVLAGLSGVIMGGALPALSSQAHRRPELDRLVARVWHWLIIGMVPLFIAVALFAPLLVHITLGARYAGSVPLLRILCLAGEISIVNNVAANLQIALHKTRAMMVQGSVAIVVNVAGNLILVPRIGVSAAAWMTAATELLVCSSQLWTLRHDVSVRGCARVSLRPILAIVISTALAFLLIRWQLLAALASGVVFLTLISRLRAWPAEFRLPLARSAD